MVPHRLHSVLSSNIGSGSIQGLQNAAGLEGCLYTDCVAIDQAAPSSDRSWRESRSKCLLSQNGLDVARIITVNGIVQDSLSHVTG